jgi:gas vesicle protein
MSNSSAFGKFVAGALVGGAVGAVIGMLLAPRSGSETRELIREELDSRYRESTDSLRDKSELLKEKAAAFREKMTDLSSELEETGRKTVSRFTEAVKKTTGEPTT